MNYAQAQRAAQKKRTTLQVAMVILVALIFGFAMGWQAAIAALYGSLIVALNTFLQVWQLKRADRVAGLSAERNLRYLYRCAAERLTVTVALLAAGFAVLMLEPLPLLVGYITAQTALVYGWFLESSARRKHG